MRAAAQADRGEISRVVIRVILDCVQGWSKPVLGSRPRSRARAIGWVDQGGAVLIESVIFAESRRKIRAELAPH